MINNLTRKLLQVYYGKHILSIDRSMIILYIKTRLQIVNETGISSNHLKCIKENSDHFFFCLDETIILNLP